MKTDIKSREDIERLVLRFYEKVRQDPDIGYFFSEVVHVNWERHIPVMVDFWENVVFYSGGYAGNPMVTHKAINRKSRIAPEQFQRWVYLFESTVRELFAGERADSIIQRAKNIAFLMELKINA